MNKLDMKTSDLINNNIQYIIDRFPNVVTETKNGFKVDFDALKQELSDVVLDEKKEKYELTWPGKKQAILESNIIETKTLRPLKDKSVDFDETKNIYIEGDNLEALKILQESYLNKIKCIYIDPPYNTGNDFIYNDNFDKTSVEELKESGQIDELGNRLITNNSSNGRFHSDWLSMMYPRLKLARNLLSKDGVIFISIDDNEQDNLKKICNEIFGEKNFVAQLVWEKKKKGAFLSKNYINMKEYILVYSKSLQYFKGLIGEINQDSETYPCIKTTNARGIRLIKKGVISKNKESNYIIDANTRISSGNMELIYLDKAIIEDGILQNDVRIDSNWIYGQDKLDEFMNNNDLYITQDNYIRRFVSEDRIKMLRDLLPRVGADKKSSSNFVYDLNLNNDGWGTNEDANDELHQLLEKQYLFNYSKPSKLISKLIQSTNIKDGIFLDFFSGSATTAHAIMQLNAKDGGTRRYILIQVPELCSEDSDTFKAGYNNICELGEERIRRTAQKLKEESNACIDYGFRVYKVDSSNMKEEFYKPAKDVTQMTLKGFESNIKEDRTSEDLLTQVLLDLGVTLDLPIIEKKFRNNNYYVVDSNVVVACFDEDIDISIVDEIAILKPLKVVFRDSSFNTDKDKINFEERLKRLSPDTEFNVL